jgi:hypothetical protein
LAALRSGLWLPEIHLFRALAMSIATLASWSGLVLSFLIVAYICIPF